MVYYRNKLVPNAETEELIVRLHREGKNIREIAKVVHKNFTYISIVLRRRIPEEYIGNNTTKKETRALALMTFIGRSRTVSRCWSSPIEIARLALV